MRKFHFPAVNIYKHYARNLKTIFILIICYYRIHLAIIPLECWNDEKKNVCLNEKKKKKSSTTMHNINTTKQLWHYFVVVFLCLSSSCLRQINSKRHDRKQSRKDKASACTETKRNLVNLCSIMHIALYIPYYCMCVVKDFFYFETIPRR